MKDPLFRNIEDLRVLISIFIRLTVLVFIIFGISLPSIIMAQNSITVLTPDSDDTYNTGDQVYISWSDNYDPGHVGINLIDSSGNVEMNITEYFPNSNYYTWSMPGSVTSGSYKIEVYHVVEFCFGGNCQYNRMDTDDTGESFDIQIPELDFDPSYDDSDVIAGEDFYFEWDHNLTSGQLELHYGDDTFGWTEITTLSNTATSYTWTTPSGSFPLSPQIRIRSTGSSGLEDQISINLLKDIEVTSPTGSTNQLGGTNLSVTWDANYNGGSVRVDLYKGGSHQQTLTSSTNNDGAYNWSVPLEVTQGSNYQIRVKDTGSSVKDFSPNFTLTPHEVTVTAPTASIDQIGGTTLNITWNTTYSGGNVEIDLYKGGSFDQTIVSATPNDGAYNWSIPTGIATSSDYQVRIKDSGTLVNDLSANFDLTERTITAASPTSSTDLVGGSTLNINWNSSFSGSDVRIELHKGGSLDQTITSSTTNDGSYNWTVPVNISSGSDYKIRVKENGTSVDDYTANFTLNPHTVTVTSPSSSTDQIGLSTLSINWNTNYTGGNVRIELHKGGSLDQTITSSTTNDGSYNWTVPADITTASNYQVRVKDTGSAGDDYSENFTLNSRTISITAPVSTTSQLGNSTLNINWNTNYSGGNVRIELHKGGSLDQTITSSTTNDGSYNWTVPLEIAQSSNYKIRVKDAASSIDNLTPNFTLTPREVTVTDPLSTVDQVGGSTLNITWTSTFSEDVRIDLHKGGSLDQTITSSTNNDGAYYWTIPIDITQGSDYKIRIKDTGTTADHFSDNFTLNPQSITVTSPGSSTSLIGGETLQVNWGANYSNSTVQVDLYKNGSHQQQIESAVNITNGNYDWDIPTGITTGSDYQIRVKDTGSSVEDNSTNFSLTKASLSITSPDNTDEYRVEDNVTISWTDNGFDPQKVSIDLLNSDDSVNQTLIEETTNTGSYQFTLSPLLSEGYYKVKVYALEESQICEEGVTPPCYIKGAIDEVSDNFFIKDHEVVITEPTSSLNAIMPGDSLYIEWYTTTSPFTIGVGGEGQGWIIDISHSSTTSDPSNPVYNSLKWQIPQDMPFGTYIVNINYDGGQTSSEPFTVGQSMVGAQKTLSYDKYDDYGNLLQATDANGGVHRFYYGSNSQPLTQNGEHGTNGVYLTGMSRVFTGGADSLTTSGSYDNLGQLTGMIGENGVEATFSYDADGRLDTVYNDNGDPVTAVDYVYADAQFSATNPNYIETIAYTGDGGGPRQATEYLDGLGRSIQTQQRDGSHDIVSTIEYDGAGREFRSWKPYRWDTGHQYDSGWAGNDTTYYGNEFPYVEQHYEQSPMNRVVKAIPEGGQAASGADSTAYRLDTWNGDIYSVTKSIDAEGNVTETWTDGWGRTVRTVADPDTIAAETLFEYDVLDNLEKVTAPNGTETTYSYDPRGNLTQKTSDDAGSVQYKYDVAGNLRFSQDANRATAGEVMFTSYDELGRPFAEGVVSASLDTLDGDTDYGFGDTNANVHGAYAYDSKSTTNNKYPFDQFVTELDSVTLANTNGQLAARAWRVGDGTSSMIGSNPWQLEALSYDSEGRLADKWVWTGDNPGWAYHLHYDYNRAGELITQQLTVGGETLYHHYTYNKRGLVDKVYLSDDGVADTEPAEITYSYSATGAVEQIDYRGGTTITNGYDLRDRLTDINDITSTSGSTFAAKYTYQKNSNVDQAEFWNPNITTGINLTSAHRAYSYQYNYDGLNRLTSADYRLDGSNPDAFDVPSVSYDRSGNIEALQRRDQAGALVDDLDYKYENGNNQLSSLDETASSSHPWDPKAGNFTYDANGNLETMTGNTTLTGVTYDHRNLPMQFDLSATTQQVNGYSMEGQRVFKEVQTSGGTSWNFYIMDGLTTLGLIQDGSLQYLNILGNDVTGRVLASSGSIDANNAKRFYLKDLIGSTRAVVDENGTTKENRDYYPFGLLMDERQYVNGAETTEKFSGKERDDQTGFDYFGARYYHSGLGRFISTDRFAEKYPSMTPYQYAANNPAIFIDVNGDSVEVAYYSQPTDFFNFIPSISIPETYHTFIIYTNEETGQTVNIAEGMPENKLQTSGKSSALGWGKLVAEQSTEAKGYDSKLRETVPTPESMTDSEFADKIIKKLKGYKKSDNKVNYSPIPSEAENTGNSKVTSLCLCKN